MIDIVDWAQSEFGFFVDRWYDADAGRWILQRRPIQLAEYHRRILRHCFALDDDGKMPYDTVCLAEPAKSGKSCISALIHAYFALHVEPPAEQYVVSNKRDQAQSRVFKALCESFEWNPHLSIDPNRYELTTRSGTVVKAIPSNARTEAGARYTLVSFDEPWAIVYQDGERLVAEFKKDPTRNVSVKLFTGYGGYSGESELWENLLNTGLAGEPVPELDDIANDDGTPSCWANGRHFVFWSHTCRQPWQTEAWIESQRKSLRSGEFARMIQTRFVQAAGDFIEQESWHNLIDGSLLPLEPGSRAPIFVGVDLAVKPGGDDCALVALYWKGERLAIGFHKIWRGGRERKTDLRISETVEPFLLDIARSYNLACIALDPWQGMGLGQRLASAGLPVVEVPQTHASRGVADTILWEFARNRDLVLYDHPDLKAATASASAKQLGDGKIFIQKSGRGTIDLLVAISNAIFGLGTVGQRPKYRVVYEPVRISPYY